MKYELLGTLSVGLDVYRDSDGDVLIISEGCDPDNDDDVPTHYLGFARGTDLAATIAELKELSEKPADPVEDFLRVAKAVRDADEGAEDWFEFDRAFDRLRRARGK